MAQRIAIVDYGMGNLRSVQKALAHVAPGAAVEITADPAAIHAADRVVFPGQGAMPDCMKCLGESGLGDAVREAARSRPFLGLCIGLQMLFDRSEEGDTPGLGILPGRVVRFAQELMTDEETRRSVELERYFVVKPAFLSLYREIGYTYACMVSDRVDRPYHSANETPLPLEDLRAFLYENSLIEGEETEPFRPSARF